MLFLNAILVFTRISLHHKIVSCFKPLLDVYQGPYEDNVRFWTGLQLVMRAVIFGLSTLDRNTNLMLTLLLIGVITVKHIPN